MGPRPNNCQQSYRWSLVGSEATSLFESGESLQLPPAEDLPEFAQRCLLAAGFTDPQQAIAAFELPNGRWVVLPQTVPLATSSGEPGNQAWLRAALLLGLCTESFYDRDGPVIWTQRRLSRAVQLFRPLRFHED